VAAGHHQSWAAQPGGWFASPHFGRLMLGARSGVVTRKVIFCRPKLGLKLSLLFAFAANPFDSISVSGFGKRRMGNNLMLAV